MKGQDIYKMKKTKVETRWFTYENVNGGKGAGGMVNFGRKGAPARVVKVGETIVLADINGSGTIRRMWATLAKRNKEALRGLKIEIYWEDAKTPAVQAPFGDFFCHQLGNMSTFENDCFSSPEGRSFVCYIPMPFRKSAKVLLINESGEENLIYYEVDCTINEDHDENVLYFHSYWRRENYTTLRKDMDILPRIKGKGRFIGCNVGIRLHPELTNFWWGEGEVKIYLDGDSEYPTLCGTGTEDYIATAYGQGVFSNRFQGCTYISEEKDMYSFHRFHIPDPVYFYDDIYVTISAQGGPQYPEMLACLDKFPHVCFMKPGDGTEYFTREELEKNPEMSSVIERIDDYSTTAYWYMDNPENLLPLIPEYSERIKDVK